MNKSEWKWIVCHSWHSQLPGVLIYPMFYNKGTVMFPLHFKELFLGHSGRKLDLQFMCGSMTFLYLHLKEEQLYISHKKFEPFAPVLDILGCKVDTYRVHTNSDKMAKVRNWAIPRDHNKVLQFLSLVEYLAHFMHILRSTADNLQQPPAF